MMRNDKVMLTFALTYINKLVHFEKPFSRQIINVATDSLRRGYINKEYWQAIYKVAYWGCHEDSAADSATEALAGAFVDVAIGNCPRSSVYAVISIVAKVFGENYWEITKPCCDVHCQCKGVKSNAVCYVADCDCPYPKLNKTEVVPGMSIHRMDWSKI
jgi:hypothetical protein